MRIARFAWLVLVACLALSGHRIDPDQVTPLKDEAESKKDLEK